MTEPMVPHRHWECTVSPNSTTVIGALDAPIHPDSHPRACTGATSQGQCRGRMADRVVPSGAYVTAWVGRSSRPMTVVG